MVLPTLPGLLVARSDMVGVEMGGGGEVGRAKRGAGARRAED